jgi:hypothetical protein
MVVAPDYGLRLIFRVLTNHSTLVGMVGAPDHGLRRKVLVVLVAVALRRVAVVVAVAVAVAVVLLPCARG